MNFYYTFILLDLSKLTKYVFIYLTTKYIFILFDLIKLTKLTR